MGLGGGESCHHGARRGLGGQGAVTRRADRQGASALLREAGSQEASGRTGPLGP